MKNKSLKQRRKIYLEAARIFAERENECLGICFVLTKLGLYGYSYHDSGFTIDKKNMCPEAHLISLKKDGWYENFEDDNSIRVMAMILASVI